MRLPRMRAWLPQRRGGSTDAAPSRRSQGWAFAVLAAPRALASSVSERTRLLRTLRAVGAPLLLALVAIQLIGALAPAGTALTTAYLVGTLLDTRPEELLAASLTPLAAYGFVIFVGRSSRGITDSLRYLAVQRIDGEHRAALSRLLATTPTIDPLERPVVCELLRVAQADRQSWVERTPGMGATAQLDVLLRMVGAIASCLVLVRFAWWLVPLMAVPALASRTFTRRQCLRHISMQRTGVMEGVRAEHWNKLATEATDGKEVRTFGLADWAVKRSLHHILAMSRPRWASEIRNNLQQWVNAAIIAPPLLVGYVLVTYSTLRGDSDVATLTAVFLASWSLIQSLGSIDVFDVEGGLVSLRAYEQLRSELTAAPARVEPPKGATPPSQARGNAPPLVRFEKVSFTYPDTRPSRSRPARPRDQAGRAAGRRRPQRCREIDADQAAGRPLPAHRGQNHGRRGRHRAVRTGCLAPAICPSSSRTSSGTRCRRPTTSPWAGPTCHRTTRH